MKDNINPVVAIVVIVLVVGVALIFGWKAMGANQAEAPKIDMSKMGAQMKKPGS